MRNLSDKCKTCNDNHFSMPMCFDCCGVPIDILNEIERKRNEEQKAKALEQEPKTGHWIPVFQGDEVIDYRCSRCEFGNTFGKGTVGMYYCPRCGARMVEPQERNVNVSHETL